MPQIPLNKSHGLKSLSSKMNSSHHEIKKGTRLGVKIAPRGIQRVQLEPLFEPIGKEYLQLPIRESWFDPKFQHLCDAVSAAQTACMVPKSVSSN